jgi:hypothetical protein
MSEDLECICKINWRKIIKESKDLFEKTFLRDDEEYIFTGVMHGLYDYYYVMWNVRTKESSYSSCVGSIEGWGFTLKGEQQNEST